MVAVKGNDGISGVPLPVNSTTNLPQPYGVLGDADPGFGVIGTSLTVGVYGGSTIGQGVLGVSVRSESC
jgi:hypothetical protein